MAAALNPLDPQIPLAQANSLRRSMSQAEGWSESAYARIIGYYLQAAKLEPYETLVPLAEVQFQIACGRQDEALDTMVKRALPRQPGSRELLAWLFANGAQNQNVALAQAALDRALELEPENPFWWHAQYVLARGTGQTAAAQGALTTLLTARPGDAQLIDTSVRFFAPLTLPDAGN